MSLAASLWQPSTDDSCVESARALILETVLNSPEGVQCSSAGKSKCVPIPLLAVPRDLTALIIPQADIPKASKAVACVALGEHLATNIAPEIQSVSRCRADFSLATGTHEGS